MTAHPRLVDIGINLMHEDFAHDLDAVLARARANGIAHLVITGSSRESSPRAAALAATNPAFYSSTAGIHPHHAAELDADTVALLRALLRRPEVVAAGECGLDYFRDIAPRATQRAAFEQQVALAIEARKPLFLHQRDAHEDFLAVLRAAGPQCPPGVAHCFTGTRTEAEAYLALGLCIGITGWICDERRGQHLLEVVRHIPAGRLMLETDAPYLLPRTLQPKPRSRRNEPCHLVEVCRVVALARGESVDALAAHTSATAHQLFGGAATWASGETT